MNVFRVSALALGVSLAITACGGGGGSSSSSTSTASRGFTLPSEISAVPSDNTSGSALKRSMSVSSFSRAVSALASTSDYSITKTKKFVEERALEQFEIIEQVLNAVGQTNYAEPAVINQGAYTAMVAWIDDEDGREVKTLEPWVVNSTMILVNGADVNKVQAWIEEPDWDNPGQTRVVKAEFMIYQAASTNADGSFSDYGIWDLNVSFDASATSYFSASSTIDGTVNTIKVHEVGMGDQDAEMKGILVRSGATGHGKVEYPDWESCWQSNDPENCSPSSKTAQYAYNASYLGVDGDIVTGGVGDAIYKDRNPANAVEIAHRYGLFYDENPPTGITAGDDVEKHVSFGFPLKFDKTVNSVNMGLHAYYGAWQGRHEIWGARDQDGNALLAAGNTVIRDDRGSNQTVQSYKVSPLFNGTLTKRELVDSSLADIQGIVVETWTNKNFELSWSGAAWQICPGYLDWQTQPPVCKDHLTNNVKAKTDFTDFQSLVVGEKDRKHVNIDRWNGSQNVSYVYLTTDTQGVSTNGFYEAQMNNTTHKMEALDPLVPYNTPTGGDSLWVNIGGSIYIQYTGTGWVEKTISNFSNWQPEFDDSKDLVFQPEQGREYYISNQGANYVVKRVAATSVDADDYEVKSELQSAANPVNVAAGAANPILPVNVSYFATPWETDVRFELETSAASANFMKLVYAADDPATQDVDETDTAGDGSNVPAVLEDGKWGLQVFNGADQPLDSAGDPVGVDQWGVPTGASRPVEFNWEYSQNGGWGAQQFLCSPDCSAAANYVLLDNPIQLSPITSGLVDGTGTAITGKTMSFQFDGWMHGMPDLYWELSKNNFNMTTDISSKIVIIPAGTAVTDANSGDGYYVKPLEISVFLDVVPNTTPGIPDITVADDVDLATVPGFTDHGMGAKPTGTAVLYSEGLAVGSN
ncbi:hypothetical protein ACFL2V_01840 [Pseudomonadota bacterium]